MGVSFRIYLELSDDQFGFESSQKLKKPDDDDVDPIRPFSIQRLLDRLSGKKLAGIGAKVPFNDKVEWAGDRAGGVRSRITPNGNMIIERKVQNLEGDEVWYTYKVFKIDIVKFTGYEDSVADAVFNKVEKAYKDKLDSPSRDYKDLSYLAKRLTARLRQVEESIFVFEDIKKVNDNQYVIYFSLPAAGAGRLIKRRAGGQTPEIEVNVSYDKHTGMIRVIFNTVSTENRGQGWEVDVPYFDGLFTPSQDKDVIINAIATTVKYF
jgi:hypothetical protein